jgi:thiol-disulfide isomerase/thioredoxin
MGGFIVLVVVLGAATVTGLALRTRRGKFKAPPAGVLRPVAGRSNPASPAVLTAEELGAPLGARATLVQFSTEFCANCPPTRRMLGQVAQAHDGVDLVEVDAAARLDLARRLNIYSTPTILVLGPDGAIASRASGQPRKADVLAAVGEILGAGAP